MRILVLGAGAVGSALGAFLSRAGHAVRLVGRGEHVRAIRKDGLRVRGLLGEFVAHPEAFSELPAALDSFAPDWILLTVKSPDTRAAAEELRAALAEEAAPILHIQNGIGNYELLRKAFPHRPIVSGMVIIGFRLPEAGAVEVTVYGGDMKLGARPRSDGTVAAKDRQRTQAFAEELQAASGIGADAADDIESWLWAKLLYNAALNPLGAMLKVNYGRLEQPETVSIMRDLLHEAFAVAAACEVKLFWKDAEEYLEHLRRVQIPATREHRPSMLGDLERGRRTEIDFLNGAIVRLGEERGLAAPVNASLVRLIRFLETQSGQIETGGPR